MFLPKRRIPFLGILMLSVFCILGADGCPHPAVGTWVYDGSFWTLDENDNETLIIEEAETNHTFRWETDGVVHQAGNLTFFDKVTPKRVLAEILDGPPEGAVVCNAYSIGQGVFILEQRLNDDCTLPDGYEPDNTDDAWVFYRQ